jgi:hypothetical protein
MKKKLTEVLAEAILFDHKLIQRIRNRSSYTAIDIIDFFEQFKYYQVEWLLGVNKETLTLKVFYIIATFGKRQMRMEAKCELF